MIRLCDVYKSRLINGMTPQFLMTILDGENPDINVKQLSNTILLKSNKDGNISINTKILKCIREYYLKDGKGIRSSKSSNAFMECTKVQSLFDVPGYVGTMNCSSCHRYCLRQFMNKELTKRRNVK